MIYFAQDLDGGPIKIGFSTDVTARIHQLELSYNRPLALLATMPGDMAREAEIHHRFAHLRLEGRGRRGCHPEQFRPAADLMAFIGRPFLVSPNPDAVELMISRSALNDDGRDDTRVKVDVSLAGKAKLVATHRGIPVAEFLTELLRRPIDQAYVAMLRELEGKKE